MNIWSYTVHVTDHGFLKTKIFQLILQKKTSLMYVINKIYNYYQPISHTLIN